MGDGRGAHRSAEVQEDTRHEDVEENGGQDKFDPHDLSREWENLIQVDVEQLVDHGEY